MSKKYWVGTGTQPRKIPYEQGEGSITVNQDVGLEFEADELTIEPSGALTLWSRQTGDAMSYLIMAFAPGQWTKAHVIIGQS